MTTEITVQEAVQKIQELPNGAIYSVLYIKKDGSNRLMNSIRGTRRGVKGVGLAYDPAEKGLLPVYDLQLARKYPNDPDKCWRTVNLQTLKEVTCGGITFTVTKK